MAPPLASPPSGAQNGGAATSPPDLPAALQTSPSTHPGPPLAPLGAAARRLMFVSPARPGEALEDVLLRDFHVTALPGAPPDPSPRSTLAYSAFPCHLFQFLLCLIDVVFLFHESPAPSACAIRGSISFLRECR